MRRFFGLDEANYKYANVHCMYNNHHVLTLRTTVKIDPNNTTNKNHDDDLIIARDVVISEIETLDGTSVPNEFFGEFQCYVDDSIYGLGTDLVKPNGRLIGYHIYRKYKVDTEPFELQSTYVDSDQFESTFITLDHENLNTIKRLHARDNRMYLEKHKEYLFLEEKIQSLESCVHIVDKLSKNKPLREKYQYMVVKKYCMKNFTIQSEKMSELQGQLAKILETRQWITDWLSVNNF